MTRKFYAFGYDVLKAMVLHVSVGCLLAMNYGPPPNVSKQPQYNVDDNGSKRETKREKKGRKEK